MSLGAAVTGQQLDLTLPARPESVRIAREAAADHAQQHGAGQEQLDAVRLAVSEAVTNVVLHAYRDQPGLVHLSVVRAEQELWVLVGDDGCGFSVRRDSPGLGLGLVVIARLCEELAVVKRSTGGTELRMRFPLSLNPPPRDGEDQQRPLASARSSRDAERSL